MGKHRDSRLPTFVLAGAPRCGTTSVYHMLNSNPEVFLPEKKELWFFYTESEWLRGVDWYADCFSGHGGAKAVGEATPLYFCDPKAVRRMAKLIPDLKILLVLRNPIERLSSHYWFNVRKSKEPLEMEEAVEAELSDKRPWKLDKGALNYVGIGLYDTHIRRLWKAFSPAQVHVIIIEEIVADPNRVFEGLWGFLGVAPMGLPTAPKKNEGQWLSKEAADSLYRDAGVKRALSAILPESAKAPLRRVRDKLVLRGSSPDMPDSLRERLEAVYAPSIAALEKLLGRDLSVWRSQGDW